MLSNKEDWGKMRGMVSGWRCCVYVEGSDAIASDITMILTNIHFLPVVQTLACDSRDSQYEKKQ